MRSLPLGVSGDVRARTRASGMRVRGIDRYAGPREFTYDGTGNIASVGTSANWGTQGYRTYGYDRASRLVKAQIGSVPPSQTYEYEYDPYGNRRRQALDAQWMDVPVDSSTNRLGDATYDVSGNQLTRGATSATYDG